MARNQGESEQLENALIERLDRLERRIQKMREEQEAIRLALSSHRGERLRYKGALRKNSFTKLLVERRIQNALRKNGRRMAIDKLYEVVAVVDGERMPESTFRSHLHRMKAEGLIVSDARGSYRLPDIFD